MIDLTTKEKDLIIAAISIEKNKIKDEIKSGFLEKKDLKELADIEDEFDKKSIFISRKQMYFICYLLGELLDDKKSFNSANVLKLESKLDAMASLP